MNLKNGSFDDRFSKTITLSNKGIARRRIYSHLKEKDMTEFDDPNMDNIPSDEEYVSKLPDANIPTNIPDLNGLGMSGQTMMTDIFGQTHFCDPMDVDIMSGIPSSEFHHSGMDSDSSFEPSFEGSDVKSYDQMKLDKSEEIEAMRDTAVEHYKDAKAAGDIDEMLKWEAEANKQQGRLYDHWGTPTYGLPPKAPGIS